MLRAAPTRHPNTSQAELWAQGMGPRAVTIRASSSQRPRYTPAEAVPVCRCPYTALLASAHPGVGHPTTLQPDYPDASVLEV